MTIEGQNCNISAIQALRGIAAVMVVVFHLHVQTERLGLPDWHLTVLAAGVDIFFVISGFIMWVTTAGRPERTAASFYRDRIARIVPLYWAITTFMVLVLVVAPQLTQTAVLDVGHAVLSFLFIASPNPIDGTYTPLLIPGWTLNYEMFFYLLFGGAIAIGGRSLRLRAGLIVVALGAIAAVGQLVDLPGTARFYASDIILEFAFGIGLGAIYLGVRIVRSHLWWLVAATGAALLALSSLQSELRAVVWGIPASLIVAGAVFARPIPLPGLKQLGDWSYSLYLSHPIVLSAAGQAWRQHGGDLPAWLFSLAAVVVCVVVSAAIYHLAERPMNRWAKARLSRGRELKAAPAPAR